ncbi:hypothetical protein LCGC14_2285850 [marine sediment metagenome]|uniref:Uncharacterized protein n=1 Tax=marine sediment metagenome TaxID=412755 RepID=A0A0F9DF59_9ZZZZ
MAKKSLLNQRRDRIRQWFANCDPKDTQVRDALKRAAKMIWERQTVAEQDAAVTTDDNGIGYNGYDAQFASRIINWKGTLTERMALGARKMLRKYARQLAEIALRREVQE